MEIIRKIRFKIEEGIQRLSEKEEYHDIMIVRIGLLSI